MPLKQTLFVLLFVSRNSAHADWIQGELGGHVTSVDSAISTPIQPGDPFEFSYRFDSNAVDLTPQDPTVGSFSYPDFRLELAGNKLVEQAGDNSIVVWAFEPLKEQYVVYGRSMQPFVGMDEPIVALVLDRWPMKNWLFTGDAIPKNLDINDFDYTQFTLEDQVNPGPLIQGVIETGTYTVIPEPATGGFALILAALALRRRPARLQVVRGQHFAGATN